MKKKYGVSKNNESVFVSAGIPNYNTLRKSFNMIPFKLDSGREVLLCPLMVSNSVVSRPNRYLSDRTSMLYRHITMDSSSTIKMVGRDPNKNYDEISYADGVLSLKLVNGVELSVSVSMKVQRYAEKLINIEGRLKNQLISAMYIYTNIVRGYNYPVLIFNGSTDVVKVRDGRLLGVKKDPNNDLANLNRDQQLQVAKLKKAGTKLLSISKELSIGYLKLTNLMSMIYYVMGYSKTAHIEMANNKYIDFIIREMMNIDGLPTIELKRDIINYLIIYKCFIDMNKDVKVTI